VANPQASRPFDIDAPKTGASSVSEASSPLRTGARSPLALFLISLTFCLLAYLGFATHGRWWTAAPDQAFGVDSIVVARGSAFRHGDELVITREGIGGETVISVTTSLLSIDYAMVSWVAIDVPESAQVVLLWHTDYEPDHVNRRLLRVTSGRPMPTWMGADPHWIGRITGLALTIHGPLTRPIRIRGLIVKPADAEGTMLDRVREWTAFEPWTGASINSVTGGADIQDLPLPLLLAFAVGLAGAALAYGSRHELRANAPELAVAVAVLFVAAWFLLDVRWTYNLALQTRGTALRYADKDWRAKHLAAEDGPLFAFIEKVRQALPSTPARVFVLADAAYFRGRAAYHLYPHNVWYEPYINGVPPADRLKSGDFIVVYQRRGVQYDAAAQRLRWDNNVTVPVELKLVDGGNALFVVR